MEKKRYHFIAFFLIVASVALPAVIVGTLFHTTPSVTPEEAAQLMRNSQDETILIDVRPAKEFQSFSLQGSVNVPLDEPAFERMLLDAVQDKNKQVLLICDAGLSSARATQRVRSIGYSNAMNVQGGIDSWLSSNAKVINKKVRTLYGDREGAPSIVLSSFEQFIITTAVFVLKPLYQILSIIIVVMLWKRTDTELKALKWGVLSFFIGENACALNFLFFNETSLLMEYVHATGMLLCLCFVVYAVMEALDKRVIHVSEESKKCALLAECGPCYKYSSIACNARLLLLFVIPATAILAAMPLTAQHGSHFYTGTVFGTEVVFGHPVIYQVLEARLYPIVALLFFTISFLSLLLLREKGFEPAKLFYAMGAGPLGFSLLRFMLYWGYQQNPLWADAWEEITELLFIAGVFWVLLRVRHVSRQSGLAISKPR